MSDRDNVVSFSDHIEALKQKMDGDEPAVENNFQPSEQDIHTFLMVLRHLQKKSNNQTVELELGAEFFTVKVIESVADELTNKAMFFDIKQKARAITFDFPWFILDIDKSTLRKEDSGKNAVELLGGAIHRWFNDIAIAH